MKTNNMKETEKRKARGCKNLSSHIPAEFPLKKGINDHWETMMTRQRKERGRGRKEHDLIKVYTEQMGQITAKMSSGLGSMSVVFS